MATESFGVLGGPVKGLGVVVVQNTTRKFSIGIPAYSGYTEGQQNQGANLECN